MGKRSPARLARPWCRAGLGVGVSLGVEVAVGVAVGVTVAVAVAVGLSRTYGCSGCSSCRRRRCGREWSRGRGRCCRNRRRSVSSCWCDVGVNGSRGCRCCSCRRRLLLLLESE